MQKAMQSLNWLNQRSPATEQLYITISPCIDCAKLIIQSGISRVVYGDLYRNKEGINLLKKQT